MKTELKEMIRAGGLETFTIQYYSADVEVQWTFDDDQMDDPSLQIVYKRSVTVNQEKHDENFWLYLSTDDAIAIGKLLVAWGEANEVKQ